MYIGGSLMVQSLLDVESDCAVCCKAGDASPGVGN